MQRLLQAQDALRRACFKIMMLDRSDECYAGGTGFFISTDGFALTAYHVLPGKIVRSGGGTLDIVYRNRQLQVDWLCDLSNADSDIAVLRLRDTCEHRIECLHAGFFDQKADHIKRCQFWAGRSVCAYGFPADINILKDRFVDGNIDSGQPILKICEIDTNDNCDVTIKEVSRLQFVSLRSCKLCGVSGAPVMDRESGLVVAVQGSYDPDCRVVYASEIGTLLRTWPELSIHAVRFCGNFWKNAIWQHWPIRTGSRMYQGIDGYLPVLA